MGSTSGRRTSRIEIWAAPGPISSPHVLHAEVALGAGHGFLQIDELDPRELVDDFSHDLGHKDLVGLPELLAELARGVDLGSVDLLRANPQNATVTDANTQENLVFGRSLLVLFGAGTLHFDGAEDGFVGLSKCEQEAIGIGLHKNAVVVRENRREKATVVMNDLQEVNDAEGRRLPGETDEVGEHDGPLLTEEIPDALVDPANVYAGGATLFKKVPKAIETAFEDAALKGHGAELILPF